MEGDKSHSPIRSCSDISIHSLRMEGDSTSGVDTWEFKDFNPLPPHGGRPGAGRDTAAAGADFNPLPPHGGRLDLIRQADEQWHFNPLPPHGGRRIITARCRPARTFQSTPSAWRETRTHAREAFHTDISIHSLRMEGDSAVSLSFCPQQISIHSLRMEGDWRSASSWIARRRFQSTPSAWRETESIRKCLCDRVYFNPLPPHGGRRRGGIIDIRKKSISIHSLRMEGDRRR